MMRVQSAGKNIVVLGWQHVSGCRGIGRRYREPWPKKSVGTSSVSSWVQARRRLSGFCNGLIQDVTKHVPTDNFGVGGALLGTPAARESQAAPLHVKLNLCQL